MQPPASSSRAYGTSAILFAAVPLGFLVAITLYQLLDNVPQARLAREETKKAFLIRRTATTLDRAVRDAERGQRGYLITGRDAYLEPYRSAKEKIPGLISDLQRLTSNDPDEQHRLLSLQADLTTKINELAATIAARQEHGFEAAQAIVNTDAGRAAMDSITADIDAILDHANKRLLKQLEEEETVGNRFTLTFVIGSAVASVALLFGSILLSRAFRQAAHSERILLATLDSVREGVAAFDHERRLLAWNRAFRQMLKLPPNALQIGQQVPSGETSEAGEFSKQFDTLEATARRSGRPALVERKEADGRSLEVFHNPTRDGGSVTTFLDRTEQRQAEQALLQSQKLEALGQMTGGVAHDFNNLLTVIIGAASMLRRAVGKDPQALQRIDMVVLAAERGARLIQQLLAFARRQPLQPEIVNLSTLMNESLPLIRRAVGEKIVVEYVSSGGLWNTNVDAAQFQTAVLNLAINSRDAMPGGGKLTIEVCNAALDDVYAAHHAEVEPGQYVMFAITDTGKGMDAATALRALDPFFTTKPVGEGTGLGLPQVYGFVKQSGGHLKIDSEVGEGTTIKLYLPRSFGQEVRSQSQPATLALTGTETILVVDDDEIVRATVASMLESLGYDVIMASSGGEAISILENGAKIDLLFTDVVMPGTVGGRKLAERAAEISPGIKILFTSGYTENAIVHNHRLDPGVEFLSKPYDRERLAAKVRRVLDGVSKGTGDMDQAEAENVTAPPAQLSDK